MNHWKPILVLPAILLLGACASSQKEPDGPAERAGEKVDEAAEDTKDAVEDVGDKAEDQADKAEDKADEADDKK